jgi:hypothetical protein
MEEPNGQRVTSAQVYQALYEVRGEMLEQFGLLNDRMTQSDVRTAQLTGRVDEHICNHPSAKPNLAHIGGITGIVATIVTAAVTAIYGLIKRGF